MSSYTNNRIVQISFDGSVSGVLSGSCHSVIITATTACYINFNQDAVTTANGFYIPANSPVEIELSKISKVAAIKAASSGVLTILELF
jgi:hypothetical protein